MPKFSIAFVAPDHKSQLRHRVIESQDQDAALKTFFSQELLDLYSDDDQGFHYFKEDFFDKTNKSGSIIQDA